VSVTVQPTAAVELADLLADIRPRSPRGADAVEQAVADTFDLLDANPLIGTAYPSTNPQLSGVRYKLVRGYPQFVAIYRPDGPDVVIMHVVRGRRNIASILGDD